MDSFSPLQLAQLAFLMIGAAALALFLSLGVHRWLKTKVAPRLAAVLSVVLFASLAWAEAVQIDPTIKWFKNGLYIGALAPGAARQVAPSKITASYSTGPGGAVNLIQPLAWQFPSIVTSSCEDSIAVVIDAGNGGQTIVKFGDTLEWGTDQILGQSDAGALVFPYVVSPNTVKFRFCNLSGVSGGLPDASYYFRSFSGQ